MHGTSAQCAMHVTYGLCGMNVANVMYTEQGVHVMSLHYVGHFMHSVCLMPDMNDIHDSRAMYDM